MALVSEIVTAEQLREHVGAPAVTDWITSSAAAANGAVLRYLGRDFDDGADPPSDPLLPPLPPEIQAATLTVAADVFHRRQAPLGISSALDLAGVPLRVQRDWLAGVLPQLDRYRDLRQAIG
jgi:hypothetical protein